MKAEDKIRLLPGIIKTHAASMQLKLPVFPGAAFELRQLLTSDDASIDQISKVISKDQAIAGHVMKLANSAFYSGVNGNISTIRDAILRLGSNQIFNLVICSCQHTYYKTQNTTLARYLQILWQHALCMSLGSQWLVNRLGYHRLGEDAFLAGLLHDIGKLLIIKVIETNFDDNDLDINDRFILQTIDELHTEYGYKLLDSWSIPSVYCDICLNHHNQDLDTGDILLLAVSLSNQVCKKIGLSTSQNDLVDDLTELPESQFLAVDEVILSTLETVMLDVVQSEYSMLNELQLDNSTPYGIYL